MRCSRRAQPGALPAFWCTTGGAGPARTHTPTRPPRGSWVLPHTAEELAAVGIGSLLEAVELLLRFHPDDVDGPHGPAGCSLLQHAVRHGLLLLARRLLLRGADPSLAVHLAAECGQVATVRLLLQWGAPLDALDERGVTMLSKARGRGAAESGREVASLLESSAKAAQELREASRAVVSLLPKQARSPPRGIVTSVTRPALPPNGLVGERASSGTVQATAQASAHAYACAFCMCACCVLCAVCCVLCAVCRPRLHYPRLACVQAAEAPRPSKTSAATPVRRPSVSRLAAVTPSSLARMVHHSSSANAHLVAPARLLRAIEAARRCGVPSEGVAHGAALLHKLQPVIRRVRPGHPMPQPQPYPDPPSRPRLAAPCCRRHRSRALWAGARSPRCGRRRWRRWHPACAAPCSSLTATRCARSAGVCVATSRRGSTRSAARCCPSARLCPSVVRTPSHPHPRPCWPRRCRAPPSCS